MAAVKRTLQAEERAPEAAVSEPAPKPTTQPVAAVQPPAPPPPPPEPPVKATYRVWPHGTLQHNGKTYEPGTVLMMRIDDASKIVCLERVDG